MTAIQRLHEIHAAHRAAFGAEHPLIAAALSSGDESVCASVVAHVERTMPPESTGLAAVAAHLDADRRPPSLWCSIDVERPAADSRGLRSELVLARDGAVRVGWQFRRESETNAAGAPLAFRVLVPATGLDPRLVEGLGRALIAGPPIAQPAEGATHRAALLAAAIEATKQRRNGK